MKCPKNIPKIIFDDFIKIGAISASYIQRKYKFSADESFKIMKILSKYFKPENGYWISIEKNFVKKIKLGEKLKKVEISDALTPMQEIDEYLKSMYEGKRASGLYKEWEASLHAINSRKLNLKKETK